MASQKGRDIILRVRKDNTQQSYKTVAGIRKRQIRFVSEDVDVSHFQSASGWRELLQNAGQKSVEISGEGVFVDAASDARLSEVFFNREIPDFEIDLPDFGMMRGPFLVSELSYGGQHDGEMDFSIALKSAGQITMEAA